MTYSPTLFVRKFSRATCLRLLWLIPEILLTLSLKSQTIRQGLVVDKTSQIPLAEVSLQLKGREVSATDDQGIFTLSAVQDTVYFIKEGFLPTAVILTEEKFYRIQLETTGYQLGSVWVTGYGEKRQSREVAGSISFIPVEILTRNNESSLASALNLEPGVSMDTRGIGGSSRISIRGSVLRAPFGVRNIKTYWNDIPLTSPDGSTPVEVLDVFSLSGIEVLKGPAGSMYGAGTGGTLRFLSRPPLIQEKQLTAQLQVGEFGLGRQLLSFEEGGENFSLSLAYARTRYDGYRSQEDVSKDVLNLSMYWYPSERRSIAVHAYHFDGGWGLPGSISEEDARENPRQAVAFSEQADASLYRKRTRIGITHTLQIAGNLANKTTLYGNFTEKLNPFGTSAFFNGYKVEDAQGVGGRSVFDLKLSYGRIRQHLQAGVEFQRELLGLNEYTNENGQPGTLYEDSQTDFTSWLAFIQSEWALSPQTILTLGVSMNELTYDHEDFFLADSIDFSEKLRFDQVFLPRVAVLHHLSSTLTLHASVSQGYSPPTFFEVISPQGAVDLALKPEKGTNYELGLRADLFKGKVNMELTAYRMLLRDAILPETQPDGQTLFFNRGKTRQDGLEAKVLWQERNQPSWELLSIWAAYSYQPFEFQDYVKEGTQLEGNSLPGVPLHQLAVGVDARHKAGWYSLLTFRQVGRTYLNDLNTDQFGAYSLLDVRAGYTLSMAKAGKVEIYLGVNNLTDTFYTSFWQINGIRERYFNPGPTRSFYGGLIWNISWM